MAVFVDVCTYTACNNREAVSGDCSVDGESAACFYFTDHGLYTDQATNSSHKECVTAALCAAAGEYETTTVSGKGLLEFSDYIFLS